MSIETIIHEMASIDLDLTDYSNNPFTTRRHIVDIFVVESIIKEDGFTITAGYTCDRIKYHTLYNSKTFDFMDPGAPIQYMNYWVMQFRKHIDAGRISNYTEYNDLLRDVMNKSFIIQSMHREYSKCLPK